ncbi:MAG: DUF1638 domain-containing protein [Actinomycetota bacterium]
MTEPPATEPEAAPNDDAVEATPAFGGKTGVSTTRIIACGALAHELKAIVQLDHLDHVAVECLPARLHNRPSEIPEAVRARIRRARERGDEHLLVGYADCGTGGLLATVCEEEGVEMLAGAHCYEFFATAPRFAEIQDAEIGSFYLTDFLVKHFDRMVWAGLGLDRHPELLSAYFGNYTRCVFLAQADDPDLLVRAEAAAARLGLDLLVERTGYGELQTTLVDLGERSRPEDS